jgi:hypothetical protein
MDCPIYKGIFSDILLSVALVVMYRRLIGKFVNNEAKTMWKEVDMA